jgi:predicted O-linked N-acetylglucosamine transferase (SPINDLY family)
MSSHQSHSSSSTASDLFARANALWEAERFEEALEGYRAVLRLDSRHAGANRAMAMIADIACQGKMAVEYMERAVAAEPGNARYRLEYGTFLLAVRRLGAAREQLEEAVRLDPSDAEACNQLGALLNLLGLSCEAEKPLRRSLAIEPGSHYAHTNLGAALTNQARLKEATGAFRRALELAPGYPISGSNYLFSLCYSPTIGNEELFREHRLWEQRLRQHRPDDFPAVVRRIPAKRHPERIGYVSADFRAHSVAWFIEPVLRHHDRDRFRVYGYANVAAPDRVTGRLRGLCDEWRDIRGMDNTGVAEMIRADGIDVLVDLSGHTAENRLPVFLRAAAPVQVSWLGYPATTGLTTIDYRLTDSVADPMGEDRYHSERLYRLPEGFLCYQPPEDAPDPGEVPCMSKGRVTFGSFNNIPKVSPEVVATWARLLLEVPGSCLFLKSRSFADAGICDRFRRQFAEHGIEGDRLVLAQFTASRREHLAAYGRIDIALDTFPYTGTTTTFEALWMGVPVVSLRGVRHASRVGADILQRLGQGQLVAENRERYISIARDLAGDRRRLQALRGSLRPALLDSPLCDGVGFTRSLEQAFCHMWQERRMNGADRPGT